jgi:CubicO group peptidase (beta-lactamase class C family)
LTGLSSVLGLLLPLLSFDRAAGNDLPTAKPVQVGLSSERLERIRQVLRNDVERGRIPGAVVVLVRSGRVASVQAVGFRDKAAGAPIAGSPGDFYWPGAFATYWWADPKEELAVVTTRAAERSARSPLDALVRIAPAILVNDLR